MEWLILLQMAAMSFFCRHVLVRMQADLEQERQALQTRLKAALQLHMLPRNSILPLSPLDETVTTLDMLLEVGVSLHLPSPRWCLRHAAACTWVVWPAYVCFSRVRECISRACVEALSHCPGSGRVRCVALGWAKLRTKIAVPGHAGGCRALRLCWGWQLLQPSNFAGGQGLSIVGISGHCRCRFMRAFDWRQ